MHVSASGLLLVIIFLFPLENMFITGVQEACNLQFEDRVEPDDITGRKVSHWSVFCFNLKTKYLSAFIFWNHGLWRQFWNSVLGYAWWWEGEEEVVKGKSKNNARGVKMHVSSLWATSSAFVSTSGSSGPEIETVTSKFTVWCLIHVLQLLLVFQTSGFG